MVTTILEHPIKKNQKTRFPFVLNFLGVASIILGLFEARYDLARRIFGITRNFPAFASNLHVAFIYSSIILGIVLELLPIVMW